MSFYGNVINNNTMQFTFDRIYPNKQAMEDRTVDDDIFVGRFVLIDYNEEDIFKKYYKQLYRNGESFGFQNKENAFTEATVIEDENYYIELESGTTIINPAYSAEDNKQKLLINEPFYVYENNKYYFYRCLGKGNFSLIYSSQENDDVYSINFKIDSLKYELDDRGWDSTVWQKIVYEGKEKYAMIAELNSLVPEIELYVDAPTTLPEAPYFDVNSTDRIYNLHMQPSWGIRIAEVKDNDISDVKIEDEFTKWDEDKKEIITINEYQGDIYFNKAGFSADKGYKSNKTDSISLLPTGISGYNYDNQQGNKPEEDIKELSICLPSIGNAISDLWDIVYGGNSDPNNTSSYNRNTNIDWNNTSGLRLVSSSNDEYTYNTESVNTLAGCINSVHDLMGMIIINENVDNVNLALDDYIYYIDKKYNIKNLSYDYIAIPSNIEDIHIENMINFEAENTYYQGNGNYYKADKYQFGNKYYKLSQIALVENLTSEVWKKDFYYYKNNNNIYILDGKDEPQSSLDYFKLHIKNLNSITKVNNKTSIFHPTLYKSEILSDIFPSTIQSEYGKQTSGSGLFYKVNEDGNEYFIPYNATNSSDTNIKNAIEWRYFENYKIETSTDLNGKPIKTYEFSGATVSKLEIIPFEIGAFYYLNEKNQAIHLDSIENIDISKTYYKLIDPDKNINSFVPIEGKFYWPGQYYYKDENNYIYAKENNKIKEKSYYIINKIEDYPGPPEEGQSETIFYEPNKYAYMDNGQWAIDTNPTMTENRSYYINIQTRYNQTTGEVLNPNILNKDYEKMGITPCYRQEKYEWKELKGFARTLNTIHGLILHINNILKTDDKFTRDLNTVQGCINQMNDIINKIESLKPNYLIAVNKYGKMTSMQPQSNEWINVSVDGDKNQIIVNHNINEGQTKSITVGNDATTLEFGGSFNIPQLTVDKAGHVTEATNQSITLPQYTILGEALTNGGALTVTEAQNALGLGSAAYTAKSEYATAAQGILANTALQKANITTGSTNGTITVGDTDVAIKGLGSAAYTETSAYATAAQGKTADSALQEDTKFVYNIGDTTTTKTLKEIINDLNDRIIELEKQLSNSTIES